MADQLTERRVVLLHAVADALLGTVADTDGDLDPATRRAAFAYAASEATGAARPPGQMTEALSGFVDKVTRRAYAVVDADIEALRAAGLSEDAILDAVLATATGAGLARLDIGLAALAGEG
jgi:alkylhydroperoxidase family enzyme